MAHLQEDHDLFRTAAQKAKRLLGLEEVPVHLHLSPLGKLGQGRRVLAKKIVPEDSQELIERRVRKHVRVEPPLARGRELVLEK